MFAYVLPAGLQAADLEEAKRQLAAWQQSFQSIRIKARISSEAATNAMFEGSDATMAWTEYDWTWDASERFRYDSVGGINDGRRTRRLRVANLAYHYATTFNGDSEFAKAVTIQGPSPPGDIMRDTPLWILWVSDSNLWFSDRIARVTEAESTADGKLQIDGYPLRYADGLGAPRFVITLDPEHGYLPQSVRYAEQDYDYYRVDEFQEVQPNFWFPKWGRTAFVANYQGELHEHLQTWEVSQVELDPELPDSWFVPPMNDDTVVTNQFTGQTYRNGDPNTMITTEVPRRPPEPKPDPWPQRLLFVAGLCGVFVLLLRGVRSAKTRP